MGCLIAFRCRPSMGDSQTGDSPHMRDSAVVSEEINLYRERTDPEACISRTPFDTSSEWTTIPPEDKSKSCPIQMIRQSKASKWLGRAEKGVHLLEKGIAVAHTLKSVYDIGRTVATAAAPLVAMAL